VKEISQLIAALGVLRSRVHKDMPVQHIVLLLTVAEYPGITMPELIRSLGMSQGAVSRNVKALSSYSERVNGVTSIGGRDLLRTTPGEDGRTLSVFLTARGESLVAEVAGMIRPAVTEPQRRATPRRPGVGWGTIQGDFPVCGRQRTLQGDAPEEEAAAGFVP
jgi:DNA-binding MarR family transcriptional regulator